MVMCLLSWVCQLQPQPEYSDAGTEAPTSKVWVVLYPGRKVRLSSWFGDIWGKVGMEIMVLALSQGHHTMQDGLVQEHGLGLLPVMVWLGLANTAFFWAAGSSIVVSVPYMREV